MKIKLNLGEPYIDIVNFEVGQKLEVQEVNRRDAYVIVELDWDKFLIPIKVE